MNEENKNSGKKHHLPSSSLRSVDVAQLGWSSNVICVWDLHNLIFYAIVIYYEIITHALNPMCARPFQHHHAHSICQLNISTAPNNLTVINEILKNQKIKKKKSHQKKFISLHLKGHKSFILFTNISFSLSLFTVCEWIWSDRIV